VISVQAIVLSLESLQIRRNHNSLKSLSFFFSPALIDCAVTTHRIFKFLQEIKRRPDQILDPVAFEKALHEFAEFERRWKSMPRSEFMCPDEFEWHLQKIRSAGVAKEQRIKLRKRDEKENFFRSFETVETIRNPT
jgi:hypothetical protein